MLLRPYVTKSSLPRLLSLMLLPSCAQGQFWTYLQHAEAYYLGGPAFAKTQTIGGTNIAVYGSTGYSTNLGYGYQFLRKSAVSLWAELQPTVGVTPAAETASIPGSISLGSNISLLGVRLMAPLQSRISVFGAADGGYGNFGNPTLTSDNPPDLKARDVTHGVFSLGGGIDIRLCRFVSVRVDARDYVTGRNLGGTPGRNHFVPMLGFVLHYY